MNNIVIVINNAKWRWEVYKDNNLVKYFNFEDADHRDELEVKVKKYAEGLK